MADRISQAGIEVVDASTSGRARISQDGVEVVESSTSGKARASQIGVEIVSQYTRAAVLSQGGIEVVRQWIPSNRAFMAYVID